MRWAAFIVIVLLAAWMEESETRRMEIGGVTMVMLLAVLAYVEVING